MLARPIWIQKHFKKAYPFLKLFLTKKLYICNIRKLKILKIPHRIEYILKDILQENIFWQYNFIPVWKGFKGCFQIKYMCILTFSNLPWEMNVFVWYYSKNIVNLIEITFKISYIIKSVCYKDSFHAQYQGIREDNEY